ncbi:MAG: dTDP-4-dehydrorhamnose reductase [Anaerolineales bacterium]|jgi:dTDP-4-dehydrorhamnose reductase
MTMKILLIGKFGQLGWELHRTLLPLGEVTALDYPEINLAEPEQLRSLVRNLSPQVIVNAAAYTAVDQAEREPELAYAINSSAPAVLAEEANALDAVMIHYSTDYVFDGEKRSPYDENDPTNPINVYGESKLAGEQSVLEMAAAGLVFRTSWVYSLRRGSFVTKVLEWSRQHEVLRVVSDQVSKPTWCRSLAEATVQVLAKSSRDGHPADWIRTHRGLYHLADNGAASRYEWAQAILAFDPEAGQQRTRQIEPAQTSEFPAPASRPLYSVLNCTKFEQTFGLHMPDWRTSLELAMQTP